MTIEALSIQGGKEGNRYGAEEEVRVAGLLRELPIVRDVKRMPKYSREDQAKMDLRIFLYPTPELLLDEVGAQVKASTKGLEHLKETLAHSNIFDWRTWLLENKIILLISGTKSSKTGKTRRSVANVEIQEDFLNQLDNMDRYWRAKSD